MLRHLMHNRNEIRKRIYRLSKINFQIFVNEFWVGNIGCLHMLGPNIQGVRLKRIII